MQIYEVYRGKRTNIYVSLRILTFSYCPNPINWDFEEFYVTSMGRAVESIGNAEAAGESHPWEALTTASSERLRVSMGR